MTDMTLDEVFHLVEQLTAEDQQLLLARLDAEIRQRDSPRRREIEEDFKREFGLLVFDVGPWPAGLTLRRKDEYDA